MRRFAVLGDPVDGSLSPGLHTAAFRALGIDARYERHRLNTPDLEAFLLGAEGRAFDGFNVTAPLKARAATLARADDRWSRELGIANTLKREGSAWTARCTDAVACERWFDDLAARGARRVVVLGGGAMARLIAEMARERGALDVTLVTRAAVTSGVARTMTWEAWCESDGGPIDALVHATSANRAEQQALAARCPWARLHAQATVLDLRYEADGAPTAFTQTARARGVEAQDGRRWLVEQAAASFAWWTGLAAPYEEMWAASLGEQRGERRA